MKTGILILAITIAGCATAEMADYSIISKEVDQLTAAGKFNEARSLISGKGAMCKQYNNQGFCYWGVDQNAEINLQKKITERESCYKTVEQAEGSLKTQNEVIALEKSIDDLCIETFSNDLYKRLKIAKKRLNEIQSSLPFQENNKLDAIKNQCLAGIKWGYWKEPKGIAPTIHEINKLTGTFKTHNECEEARLNDASAAPIGCTERYLGETRSIELIQLDFLKKGIGSDYQKDTLLFLDLARCNSVKNSGLSNVVVNDKKILKISPLNTATLPRFTGSCTVKRLTICKNHDQSVSAVEIQQ